MSEPKQIELFDYKIGRIARQVEYVAPDPKDVDQFAKDVSARLVQKGYPGCGDPEVVNGFAAFLNFVAQVTAKQLNRKGGI